MNSTLNRAKPGTQSGARPPVAVELTPEGVLAAAIPSAGAAPVFAFEPLPEGFLVPGIGEPNLRAPEAVASALRAALEAVAARTRAVTVVIPDSMVRVFVLDFEALPVKVADVVPVLRFRLRKMIPFDVEHAGLSYQFLREEKNECKVLVAVMPGLVLQEIETAVRQAGFEPGAVLPASLAALAALESEEPLLAANLSAASLTTSITHQQDLLLYRTQDLPADERLRGEEIRRGIAVAAAYYEDKIGVRPTQLMYAGASSSGNSAAAEFAAWLDDPELAVRDLVARPETGAATALGTMTLAGVIGALTTGAH